jgi:hypothetical protein
MAMQIKPVIQATRWTLVRAIPSRLAISVAPSPSAMSTATSARRIERGRPLSTTFAFAADMPSGRGHGALKPNDAGELCKCKCFFFLAKIRCYARCLGRACYL